MLRFDIGQNAADASGAQIARVRPRRERAWHSTTFRIRYLHAREVETHYKRHLLGTFATMQGRAAYMLQRGRIVNIASIHGVIASLVKGGTGPIGLYGKCPY